MATAILPPRPMQRFNWHDEEIGLLHIPRGVNTLAGFRDWVLSEDFPEKVRATFVDQEVYLDMTMEELETHASVKAETSRVLMNENVKLDRGKFYLDGVMVTNEEAGVSNNPDAVAISWESLKAGRVRLVSRRFGSTKILEINGSPDWIMEIVSDSSVFKDTVELRRAYHRAKIGEYWLIDARGPEISFQILLWRKTGYVAAPAKDGWVHSRYFGRRFRLTRKRGRAALLEYALLVKPV